VAVLPGVVMGLSQAALPPPHPAFGRALAIGVNDDLPGNGKPIGPMCSGFFFSMGPFILILAVVLWCPNVRRRYLIRFVRFLRVRPHWHDPVVSSYVDYGSWQFVAACKKAFEKLATQPRLRRPQLGK